jgi:hypothetical protein
LLESTGNGGLIGNLSFEITGDDGKTETVWPMIPAASANVTMIQKLDAGQVTVLEIGYTTNNPNNWFLHYPFPFPKHGQSRQVTIRAVFKQDPFLDAVAKVNCWQGRVVSKPCEVVLKDDAL